MSDPSNPCPEVLWPERVPAVFTGGSLDGRELQVPARLLPPLILGVRVDQAGQILEMRPGNELPHGYTAEGWLEYWRDLRYRVCDESHTFIHRPRSRTDSVGTVPRDAAKGASSNHPRSWGLAVARVT